MFARLFFQKIIPKRINVHRKNISSSEHQNSPIRHSIRLVFGKYLLATNTISSGILMILGDLCQQEIEYQQQKLKARYDLARLGNMYL